LFFFHCLCYAIDLYSHIYNTYTVNMTVTLHFDTWSFKFAHLYHQYSHIFLNLQVNFRTFLPNYKNFHSYCDYDCIKFLSWYHDFIKFINQTRSNQWAFPSRHMAFIFRRMRRGKNLKIFPEEPWICSWIIS
jgi:hypothetical protein